MLQCARRTHKKDLLCYGRKPREKLVARFDDDEVTFFWIDSEPGEQLQTAILLAIACEHNVGIAHADVSAITECGSLNRERLLRIRLEAKCACYHIEWIVGHCADLAADAQRHLHALTGCKAQVHSLRIPERSKTWRVWTALQGR